MKGVIRAWDHYVRSVMPDSNNSNNNSNNDDDDESYTTIMVNSASSSISSSSAYMLTLEAFEVDYEAACISFLEQQFNKLPSSQKPKNLCITFNQFDPLVLYEQHGDDDVMDEETTTGGSEEFQHSPGSSSGGYLSQWLEETGSGAELRGLVLRPTLTFAGTSIFSDVKHKERFDSFWQITLFSLFKALSHMDVIVLEELTIHELLDDEESSSLSDNRHHRFGTLLRDVLLRAGRPSPPFKPSSSLIKLSLQDIYLTNDMARNIAQGLEGGGGAQLETLSLVQCHITTPMLATLLAGLLAGEARPRLREVLLSRNQFTAELLSTSLIQLLESAHNLAKLDCSYNGNFFSADLALLESQHMDLLEQQAPFALSPLEHRDWETKHNLAFSQAVQRHECLRDLFFRHIRPQASAVATPLFVSRVFRGPEKTETTTTLQLDLFSLSRDVGPSGSSSFCLQQGIYSDNIDLTIDALGYALEGLTHVPNIRSFKFHGCHLLGDVTGPALELFLCSRHNQGLVKLIFYQCKIDSETISCLVRGLRETTQCMEELSFEFTTLTDAMVGTILDVVVLTAAAKDSSSEEQCRVRKLTFRSNQLTLNSLDHFTKALLQKPNLQCLDLSLNICIFEGLGCGPKIQAFCNAIQSHPHLERLALSMGSSHVHSRDTICLLFRALESNHTLQKLVLKDSLSLPTHSDWTSSLGRLKRLTYLLLPQIFLDDAHWDVFLSGLNKNTSLLCCEFDRSFSFMGPIARLMERNHLLARVKSYNDGTREKTVSYIESSLLPRLLEKLGSSNSKDGSPVFSFLRENPELAVVP